LHDGENNRWDLSIDGLGDSTRLLLPPLLRPGFYSVRDEGEELVRFGCNTDTGDSLIDPVSEEDLEGPIDEGLVFSSSRTVPPGLRRVDLLALSMILLLAAAGLEAYAHFFRKP